MIFDLVKNGDIQSISHWLNAGNDINTINSDQNSLLGFAILNEQWQVVELLLERGASTDCVINNDPEHGSNVCLTTRPMQNNCWVLVEKLIRCGANARDCWNHLSPLGYFVQKNNIEIINLILKKFPRLANYPETHSPLKLAIIKGNLEVVKTLIQYLAKDSTQYQTALTKKQSLNGDGASAALMGTPIQFAQHYNHDDIIRYLLGLDPSLANDLDQPHNLDLSDLDPESQRSALMNRRIQNQRESDALRTERAQEFFKDLDSLSFAITHNVLPAIAIINNGRIGTAFYQCPTWMVTNAHVAPSRNDLQDWRLSSWNNDVTSPAIKRSFHRQERPDMPDLVIIEIEDNPHNSHPTLQTKFTDDKALDEIHTFYIDHDLEIKFLQKTSDENSYPLIYECLDGSSPQPGASGSPILEARVVIARKPFWQFKVVGALYARCSPEEQRCSISRLFCGLFSSAASGSAMRVCAIPVIQDFEQLLKSLQALDNSKRDHQLAQTSATFSDTKGVENENQHLLSAQKSEKEARAGFYEYHCGESPLPIKLQTGQEPLFGRGIIQIEESLLIRKNLEKAFPQKQRKSSGYDAILRKVPDVNLDDLKSTYDDFLDWLGTLTEELDLSPGDEWLTFPLSPEKSLFRIDCGGGSKSDWILQLQDNTNTHRDGYKTPPPDSEPLSAVFAIVKISKEKSSISGSKLKELIHESKTQRITVSWEIALQMPLQMTGKQKKGKQSKMQR